MIGINYRGAPHGLRGCNADIVQTLRTLKNSGFHATESNLRVLTEDAKGSKDPVNYVPTRSNILDSLQWLAADLKPNDVVYLHYIGHGPQMTSEKHLNSESTTQVGAGSKKGSGNVNYNGLLGGIGSSNGGVIVPLDFQTEGCITSSELNRYVISKAMSQNIQLYLVFDCCHSADILNLRYIYDEGSDQFITNHSVHDTKGIVYLLSGCLNITNANQLPERLHSDLRHSIGSLTNHLLPLLTQGLTWPVTL